MKKYKRVKENTKFLKFQAGGEIEGTYQGYEERPNPFYRSAEEDSRTNQPNIVDYKIEIKGEEKILSSTAQTLKDQLMSLPAPTDVKIDMVQKGIKKYFVVWIAE